jgi:hypothetical protein
MGNEIGNVDAYDILEPCVIGAPLSSRNVSYNDSPLRYSRVPASHPLNKWLPPRSSRLRGPNECIDGISAGQYLNDPSVRKAIHVDHAPVTRWSICTGLNYTSNIPALYPEPCVLL